MSNPSSEYQAIILAAGSGTRLRPLTLTTPKCLIDVGGKTILARQLERLAAAGIHRVVIVTGFLAEDVTAHLQQQPPVGMEIRLAPNPDFATTGNCMSVLAARAQVDARGIVLCDGDVVLTGDALTRLTAERSPSALLLDTETQLAEEEMKAELDDRGQVRRLSKQLDPAAAAGESIGIQKVGGLPSISSGQPLMPCVRRATPRVTMKMPSSG